MTSIVMRLFTQQVKINSNFYFHTKNKNRMYPKRTKPFTVNRKKSPLQTTTKKIKDSAPIIKRPQVFNKPSPIFVNPIITEPEKILPESDAVVQMTPTLQPYSTITSAYPMTLEIQTTLEPFLLSFPEEEM